ncbi:helix-turn-helix transcriptional regulator [Amycolatopsis sp. H20-H5]|uniref:helix-turn-helix transcriptional regulator n=1 Tax=Amycolatopsis sp. H20-H5 TaxID=3046309 RepID=UPI002DB798DD|nr:LuxR C-terminal-related transcriptional regulator [Amycolatopsis sp. H20-H5]MEC3975228.1 LuxR C-terminal-related transcriptional regulator [Amycolatopsis sp. H20-H5]
MNLKAGSVSADVVAVGVLASNSIAGLGATNILSLNRRLEVLADADLTRAEVLLVVEDKIDNKVFDRLREVRTVTRFESPPRCVIVTNNFQIGMLMTAIECGMTALLQLREISELELVRTVLAVGEGRAHLPPGLQGELLTQLDRMRQKMQEIKGIKLSGLSDRERAVFRLLADGHRTEEIALLLACSVGTVKNIIHSVMSRCGFNTRAQAVAAALRAGLI